MEEGTGHLYFDNPYEIEFEAEVVEKVLRDGKTTLVLNQTYFYPESGGQPSDKGTINGISIADVFEEGGKVFHVLEKDISEKKVKGLIDWEARFDHMQQHAGQHVLSQSFYELYGAETLSFHLGKSISTVEIHLREIEDEDVENVEKLANTIVFQDRKIKTYFVKEERIKSIPFRKPPTKKGLIRVVEIDNFDYSACGGTHPFRTGEIGLIKITKKERIRDNIKFGFLCGRRALRDYSLKNRIINKLCVSFSVGEEEIVSSTEKLYSDLKTQKKKNKKMMQRIIQYEAQDTIRNATGRIIKDVFTEKTPEEVRFLALNIIKKGEYIVLYGLKTEKKVHLVLARSETIDLDMRKLISEVSPCIKGKGGGSPSLVEIAGEEAQNTEQALDKACGYITRILTKQ